MAAGRVARALARCARFTTLAALGMVGCAAPATPAQDGEPPPAAARSVWTELDSSAPSPPAPSGEVAEIRELDLPQALEIGGASSLRVAMARERWEETRALLDAAELHWFPDVAAGFSLNKHEGALQETEGNILQVSRNSGFLGAGLFASFDLADALLEPRSARHRVGSARDQVVASVNDALLDIAVSHSELLEAQVGLALSEQNVALAQELADLTEAFARAGEGLEADAARARSELAHRRRLAALALEALELRSAGLARLLRLDPTISLRAKEQRLIPFELTPADASLDELIATALIARPELRASVSAVQAADQDEHREALRPLVPRLDLAVVGGGLGGGTGSGFRDFGETSEISLGLFWEVRNLGFGDSAARRVLAVKTRMARIEMEAARDAVTEEVAVAHWQVVAGRRQVELAVTSVDEALRSLDLNLRRIRGGEGLPLEALQAFQAAAAARSASGASVGDFNRAQLRLLRAVGRPIAPSDGG